LGITDVDPVEWDIPVARFLNPNRDDLPDVDIDFPHHKQEEVMKRIFKKWPGRSARISNSTRISQRDVKRPSDLESRATYPAGSHTIHWA
jgi:DNA polymerase III alpha subunit